MRKVPSFLWGKNLSESKAHSIYTIKKIVQFFFWCSLSISLFFEGKDRWVSKCWVNGPKWINTHKCTTMDGWCVDITFFSLGSCSPTTLLIIEGCKSVLLVKWSFKLETQGSNNIRGLPNTDFYHCVGASSPKEKICNEFEGLSSKSHLLPLREWCVNDATFVWCHQGPQFKSASEQVKTLLCPSGTGLDFEVLPESLWLGSTLCVPKGTSSNINK